MGGSLLLSSIGSKPRQGGQAGKEGAVTCSRSSPRAEDWDSRVNDDSDTLLSNLGKKCANKMGLFVIKCVLTFALLHPTLPPIFYTNSLN